MTTLSNRLLNGRPWLLSAAMLPTTTPTPTPVPTPTPDGSMSQAFTLTNWAGATSLGVMKRGVWFKKGDVPAGSVPVLSQGAAQFYGLSRWKDGSLKTARLLLRDTSLAAGVSRSYTMTAASGTSGTAAAIGNAGLVSALSGRDFKVSFANVKNSSGTTYGGGSLTASLSTHAAVSTRWTLLTTGAVADVWQGWGMAGSDAHLKVNWYITRWKNADGSTLGFQVGAAPALDWWSIAGKSDLTYDATLLDGSTTILSFPGVLHTYHSQWLMCINDGSYNAGRVPWVGAAQPTLDYSYDKTYAILAGVLPPLRRDKTPPIGTQNVYVPCNAIPNDGHRTYLDSGGPYSGRGPIPTYDANSFMLQTPKAMAISRLNALTGLGVPFHYRSNQNRTRSGEAADVANTNLVLLMAPKATSTSDFTAQGLPAAGDFYQGGSGNAGYVIPNRSPNNPWNVSNDSTHAVSYCFYQALVSGDEWFVDAALDVAMNLAHQQIYTYQQQRAPWAAQLNSACPSAPFTGLLGLWGEGPSIRALGWATLAQGHGFGILPADHQYRVAADAIASHNADYIGLNLDYQPADYAISGAFNGYLGPHFSPWMANFAPIGAYYHYALNEDARWQRMGDYTVKWTVEQAKAKRWYQWDCFRNLTRASSNAWNATTNPNIPPPMQPFFGVYYDLDATGTFRQAAPGANWNDVGVDPPPLRNGDMVYFTNQGESGNLDGVTVPGVAEGTVGYVVNLTNGDGGNYVGTLHPIPNPPASFRVSATPGGSPMSFGGQTVSGASLPTWLQSVADSAYSVSSQPVSYIGFPYYFSPGNYISIAYTALNMARHYGGSEIVSQSLRDQAAAFIDPTMAQTSDQNYYSAFDTVAIV